MTAAPGLTYYPDSEPGIRRKRRGRGFSYIAPDGKLIRAEDERERFKKLAVPPAYRDVWISPLINGHLQATGRDAQGRKQYQYHDEWTAYQAQAKFDQLIPFGEVLPRIRRRVQNDLKADAGEQTFALAAAVTLIDRASLRVGNQLYTDANGSYGALTLRNRHVRINGGKVGLKYSAKGGRKVNRRLSDAKLARVLGKINDLPGATLLSWIDESGTPQTLNSGTLNDYLTDAAGIADVTPKTFRTWSGTCTAFVVAEQGNATISDMATAASEALHNTPTIARNSYIHPAVIDLAGQPAPKITPDERDGLRVAEQRLLGFLKSSA